MRVDRPALEASGGDPRAALVEDEALALAAGLLDEEDREAPVGQRAVGVGAGEQHQDLGARRERAPGLRAADQPAALAVLAAVVRLATSEP